MSRIIVDVTQLVHWSGKLTGIPRVMYELAVRCNKEHNPDMVFASWVKELQAMCEIDFDATMQHRGEGITYKQTGRTSASPAATSSRSARKITLKRLAKYGLRQTARFTPKITASLEHRAKLATMRNYQTISFAAGDILFIPWGEWWDPRYIAKLQEWRTDGARLVPVIHDVGPMVTPQFSGHSTESLADFTRAIVPLSAMTLAVSHNTKKDLTAWLRSQKVAVPRIEVFRNGEDFAFSGPKRPTDPLFAKSGLKGKDYIMCVGTVELKKNHQLFYYVYKLAKMRGIKLPKLLIVGRPGWKTETTLDLIAQDPDVNQDVLPLHNISDEELSWLYDHCLFTVLPSLYEGWGIPVAESLARGVPCACSRGSSLDEIAEDIVAHFNPYSTDECLAAIQRWLDPKELAKAVTLTKTYKQTSWDESYQQVRTYLEDI